MNIRSVLDKMIAARASDLHLKTGTAPVVRVDGVLYTLDEPAPSASDLRDVCNQLLNEEQRHFFTSHNEIDFAFGVSGLARFRANIFMQRGTPALALRHVPVEVPSIEDLNLPAVVRGPLSQCVHGWSLRAQPADCSASPACSRSGWKWIFGNRSCARRTSGSMFAGKP